MLKTKRLIIRQWKKKDVSDFAEMSRDPLVMEYFPELLSEQQSAEVADKIQALIQQRGWGFWAVELPEQARFIGFAGLHIPKDSLPCSPCVEIGWRLASSYWNKGYATEAANAALRYAFSTLQLDEVVSFTSLKNIRSQSVMQKIGMQNSGRNFHHPDIDIEHPLSEHVLYTITKDDWLKFNL